MAVDRRLLWLGALAVVLLVAVVVTRSGTGPAAPPAGARPQPGTPAAPGATAPSVPPDVKLEALESAHRAPNEAGRDPFRFRPRAEPAAPQATRIPGVPDDQVGAPPPPRVPTGPPPPPPITLKFIGLVQKADGTKIAVLSDGNRPIHGTEGQEIEGRYKILKIGTESIELAYLDGRGRQTIRLTGQ